jgi:hypothetical protein
LLLFYLCRFHRFSNPSHFSFFFVRH